VNSPRVYKIQKKNPIILIPKKEFGLKILFNWSLDHATNNVAIKFTASKQSSIINLSIKDPISVRGEAIISQIVIAYNLASAERKAQLQDPEVY
jgi:hypothetical protein